MQMVNNEPHWERGDFTKLIDSLSKDDSQKRHDIRYALFRIKNQLEGGCDADEKHHEIGRMIQTFEGVGTPVTFANVWDIGSVSPGIEIVKRLWSVEQEHAQLMARVSVTVDKTDTPESLAKKAQAFSKKQARRYKQEQSNKGK